MATAGIPRAFLSDLLANGPVSATQVFNDAKAHGCSPEQMRRARERLGVRTFKAGMKDGWC
jgi:hypothetical protein